MKAVALCVALIVPLASVVAQDDQWKRKNDRGNRWEGRVDVLVGKPDVELVSFIASTEPFNAAVDLKVRFFAAGPGSVRVEARELDEAVQYRMESKPAPARAAAWNEFGPWSTADVIARERIPSANLGVVVYLQDATGAFELCPAFVYHSRRPAAVNKYSIYLRPNYTMRQVSYSLRRLVSGKEVPAKAGVLAGDKLAGIVFPVDLPLDGVSEGPMLLVLEGEFRNRTGKVVREYRFHHNPVVE